MKRVPYAVPAKGWKTQGLNLETAVFTDALNNTYQTTRDVASELKKEIDPFVEKAKKRVHDLVKMVQELRKENQELKREIQEAKDALAAANKTILHPTLMKLNEDPATWDKGEENKIAT
jgi:cell division septum initiation protein DivIVA